MTVPASSAPLAKRPRRSEKGHELMTTIGTEILANANVLTDAYAQQFPIPTTAAEVPGPAAGNTMTKEYVQMVGRMAYFWGWPLVAHANRAAAFSKAPEPGLLGGVLPVAFGGIAMLTDYINP